MTLYQITAALTHASESMSLLDQLSPNDTVLFMLPQNPSVVALLQEQHPTSHFAILNLNSEPSSQPKACALNSTHAQIRLESVTTAQWYELIESCSSVVSLR